MFKIHETQQDGSVITCFEAWVTFDLLKFFHNFNNDDGVQKQKAAALTSRLSHKSVSYKEALQYL